MIAIEIWKREREQFEECSWHGIGYCLTWMVLESLCGWSMSSTKIRYTF